MALILFGILLILFLWLTNRWIWRTSVRLASEVPSNKWHTFFTWGITLIPKDFLSYTQKLGKKYGTNYISWIGPYPVFVTNDPETVKDIFLSKNCVNKPTLIVGGLKATAGSGLISANGVIWKDHRKIMNKTFSHKNLLSFILIFNEEVNKILQQIDISNKEGENIDVAKTLRLLTLKNTTRTLLNRDLDRTNFKPLIMMQHFERILAFAYSSCFNPFLKINFIRKFADFYYENVLTGLSIFKQLISESCDILQKNYSTECHMPKVNSTLDYALNAVQEDKLKVEEISGEMLQLYFAAFETTSTTMFFVLSMLAMHPKYQERLYEEIITILPDNNNNEILTLEQLNRLTYLEMVLNETMRVLPVVPMVTRQVCHENVILNNGLSLPIGQMVSIDIFSLHRNKKIWGCDADTFNPDHFSPSNMATRHPYSFIPFTKGLRFCIGWKHALLFSKITLAKLLKTYKIRTDFKYEDLSFENRLTLKLSKEPVLSLELREPN